MLYWEEQERQEKLDIESRKAQDKARRAAKKLAKAQAAAAQAPQTQSTGIFAFCFFLLLSVFCLSLTVSFSLGFSPFMIAAGTSSSLPSTPALDVALLSVLPSLTSLPPTGYCFPTVFHSSSLGLVQPLPSRVSLPAGTSVEASPLAEPALQQSGSSPAAALGEGSSAPSVPSSVSLPTGASGSVTEKSETASALPQPPPDSVRLFSFPYLCRLLKLRPLLFPLPKLSLRSLLL